ncbi:MAG: 50S ribosomal protein L13 [Gemmatimonadales bacterium]
MKTFRIRKEDVRRGWYHLDAAGETLGKLAVRAAHILMGKDKTTYTPGVDNGDFVLVTNAEKIKVSGRKLDRKVYRHHTQYLSGLVEEPLQSLLRRKPSRVIELAVRRMLPKNTLGRHYLRRLKIYPGQEHPHGAQKPERIAVLRRAR